jgi:hypothetical protein
MAPLRSALTICALFVIGVAGCGTIQATAAPTGGPTPAPTPSASPQSSVVGPAAAARPAGTTPQQVSFQDLSAHRQDYVGRTIAVSGKVFFLTSCPPGRGAAQCFAQAYLADPGRTELTPVNQNQAIPLAEGGHLVSCTPQSSPIACGGWVDSVAFRVVGVLKHQVLGGREVGSVQLEVQEKHRAQS